MKSTVPSSLSSVYSELLGAGRHDFGALGNFYAQPARQQTGGPQKLSPERNLPQRNDSEQSASRSNMRTSTLLKNMENALECTLKPISNVPSSSL